MATPQVHYKASLLEPHVQSSCGVLLQQRSTWTVRACRLPCMSETDSGDVYTVLLQHHALRGACAYTG